MPQSRYETATSPDMVKQLLQKVSTRRFLFCGHGDLQLDYGRRTLCFTSAAGSIALVEPKALALIFRGVMARAENALEFVFLNGCETLALGEELLAAGVPNVLCWESLVADEAAKLFSVGFFEELQQVLGQDPVLEHRP